MSAVPESINPPILAQPTARKNCCQVIHFHTVSLQSGQRGTGSVFLFTLSYTIPFDVSIPCSLTLQFALLVRGTWLHVGQMLGSDQDTSLLSRIFALPVASLPQTQRNRHADKSVSENGGALVTNKRALCLHVLCAQKPILNLFPRPEKSNSNHVNN